MSRLSRFLLVALFAALPLLTAPHAAVASPLPSTPDFAPQDRPGGRGGAAGGDSASSEGPKPHAEVITEAAVTQAGLFDVHHVGDDIFFEIPADQLGVEMLLIQKQMESTLQDPGSFFGGGARLFVQWERNGNHVVLRQKEFDLTGSPDEAIWGAVAPFRNGPVLRRFDVEAFGPDSAAVVDVSDLFISNIPELGPIEGLNASRSWVERTWAFDDAIKKLSRS